MTHTHTHTHRLRDRQSETDPTTVTLAAHARRGLIKEQAYWYDSVVIHISHSNLLQLYSYIQMTYSEETAVLENSNSESGRGEGSMEEEEKGGRMKTCDKFFKNISSNTRVSMCMQN